MSGEWTKRSLPLKDRHTWKAKPGYSICAMDRGAIRFDYPQGWDVSADSDSLKVRDRPEPDDNCVLGVSQLHLPREIADQVPLRELITASLENDPRDVRELYKIVNVPREDDTEVVYGEIRFVDPNEKRDAFSRVAIARGSGVYCLMTFDFWADDVARCDPVWQEALRSLTLGMRIADPTVGPVVQ
jgi:hypothetical protein